MKGSPPEYRDEAHREQDPAHPPPAEARQGATLGHMRWVLRISMVLAAIGLIAAWLLL